ncbi:flagellar biosynthesis regulator FlaF [Haloferula luteola]|uniref:Flagellar biosynthesis regulator FlaF n=1 Tax=Haloferula luteola TaxID=595692 RepID=A0A840V3K5_9BACT|nr:PTPDL family protein [Haloferula luteola]MBB5352093.1 flagellar biosynthesis regulator FlaF [Haloferula luteola]
MKKTPIVFLLPFLIGLSQADTFKMKDGTKLEGTIISETSESYVALIQVTESIRDQRTLLKSDVVSVIRESADEKAFPAVKELVPTPDLLPAEDYEARIKEAEAFLSSYPDSIHEFAAKKVLKTLQEEYESVKKGAKKIDGKWVTAAEREGNAYGLDAEMAFNQFKELADSNQYVLALRDWDKLAKNFPTTQGYKDSVPVAQKLIKDLHKRLGDEVRSFDERKVKRNEDFKKIPTQDKPRTKKAIQDEMAAYETKLAAEKKAGERWISVNVWHLEGMREMRNTLAQEFQKLKDFKASDIPDGDKAYAEAWKTLKGNPEPETAAAALKSAKDAGVPASYMKTLEGLAPAGTPAP